MEWWPFELVLAWPFEFVQAAARAQPAVKIASHHHHTRYRKNNNASVTYGVIAGVIFPGIQVQESLKLINLSRQLQHAFTRSSELCHMLLVRSLLSFGSSLKSFDFLLKEHIDLERTSSQLGVPDAKTKTKTFSHTSFTSLKPSS